MGGRGASSGTSKTGNAYGSQYRTLMKSGNVLFIQKRSPQSETVMETMTSGRVYAIVDGRGRVKSVVYFDRENKRSKQIDLDDRHGGDAHAHRGYLHNEYAVSGKPTRLTDEERSMVDRVLSDWQNHLGRS